MSSIEYSPSLLESEYSFLPPSSQYIDKLLCLIRDILFPVIAHTRDELEAELHELDMYLQGLMQSCDCERIAYDVSHTLIQSLGEIKEQCCTDIEATLRGDPAAKNAEEVIAYYPGFLATLTYRIAHLLHTLQVPYIPRGLSEVAHSKTGIDIHPGAVIGEKFFIDHGTGVVVGETTEIGEDVKLYQGVTLGAKSFRTDEDGFVIPESKRHPTLEDRVTVYANATILGGQTVIGHDSVIGSSVWLTDSVPPHSKVGMEPPRIVIKNHTKSP